MKEIYFDLETTGYKGNDKFSKRHKIIQIAALSFDKGFQRYVNPGIKILPESTQFHNITNDTVEVEPTFETIWQEFVTTFDLKNNKRPVVLIAHNSHGFDRLVLIKELQDIGVDFSQFQHVAFADTLLYFRHELDEKERKLIESSTTEYAKFTLNNLHKFYFGNDIQDAHNAAADVQALKNICQRTQPNWSTSPYLLGFAHDKNDPWAFPQITENSNILSIRGIGKARSQRISERINCTPDQCTIARVATYLGLQRGNEEQLRQKLETIENFCRKKIYINNDNDVLNIVSHISAINPFYIRSIGFPLVKKYYGSFVVDEPLQMQLDNLGIVSIQQIVEESLYNESFRKQLQMNQKNNNVLRGYKRFL